MPCHDGTTTDQWASFNAAYHEKNEQRYMSLDDFAYHRESFGSPLSGGTKTGQALNAQVFGSAYFPRDCGWCGEQGHKASNCQEKRAGKPKTAKIRRNNKKRIKDESKRKSPKNGGLCFNCCKGNHFASDCKEPRKEKTEQPREVVQTVKTAPEANFRGYRLCCNDCTLGASTSNSLSYITESVTQGGLTPAMEAYHCELNYFWRLPCAKHENVSVVTMDGSLIVVDPSVERTNDVKLFMTCQQISETHSEDTSSDLAKNDEQRMASNADSVEPIASEIDSTRTASMESLSGRADYQSFSTTQAEENSELSPAKRALALDSQEERAQKRFKTGEGSRFSFFGSVIASAFSNLCDTAKNSFRGWNVGGRN